MSPLAQRLIDHAALSGPFDVRHFLYAEPPAKGKGEPREPAKAEVSEALKALSHVCDEVVRDGAILWLMIDSARTDALRDLARPARRAVRAQRWRMRPPPRSDVFGRVLRACLTARRPLDASALTEGGNGDAAESIRAAIAAAVFAAPHVSPALAGKIADFETELFRRSVALADTARLRAALPHGLIGREAERVEVMAFLGAPPAQKPGRIPKLLLTAPPGMGKSAFLADLAGRLDAGHWVIQFDFDRVTLARGGPVAWVEELTRQIGGRVPAVAAALAKLRTEHAERRQSVFNPSLAPAPDALLEAALAALAGVERLPVVLVLDTAEEIIGQDSREQFRDEPERCVLLQLLAWTDRLTALGPARAPGEAPGVAAIVAARAAPPVDDAVMQSWFDRRLELGPLQRDDAAAFLTAHDPELPAEMCHRVAAAVGGMPLHLIVASRRLAGLDADECEGAVAALEQAGLAAMAPDEALAALERRFLDRMRIADLPAGLTADDVRALAYPGMLLREMTEENLVELIAPAVGIDLSDPVLARAAFEAIGQQGWLVEPAFGGDTLRQWPDVRRAMLPLMLADDADSSARVISAAIAFHEPDPARPNAEAAYLRALSGETRWFSEHPEMARSVVASAGADIEVMPAEVRAMLKTLAPDIAGGGAPDAILPVEMDDEAPRETARRAPPPPAPARTDGLADAYELLNDTRIHAEVDRAFLAANFAQVAEIGWSTLGRMRQWPDMGRPLGARGPFRDHWLWRLALVSTVVPPPADWAEREPLNRILDCTHPAFPTRGPYPDPLAITAPAIFDFDLFCGMVSGQPFSKKVKPFGLLEIRVRGVLRAHRMLGGSRWVRALAMRRGIERVIFERIDQIPIYQAEFAKGDGAGEGVEPQAQAATAGQAASPKPVSLMLWPRPGAGADELARRYAMIRGQTPELHRALAEGIVTEGAATTLRTTLGNHSSLLRDPGASAVLDELAGARSRLDAVNLAHAVLQRADLGGVLPQIVDGLGAEHSGGPLGAIARLFAQLNQRWTWPAKPAI